MNKISVIVPIYNVEAYLPKCVESILRQTCQNLEIILVDDGSPDGCPAICDAYARQYSQIIALHKENGGLSDARNAGIRAATGDWIAFVDSDDYLNERYLQTLLDAALREKADLAVCDFAPVLEDGTTADLDWGSLPERTVSDPAEMIRMIYTEWKIVPAWNKLYRASLFQDLEFAKGKLHEDEFFIHQVLARCSRITLVSDVLYYYLQRAGSIAHRRSARNELDTLEAEIERYDFCAARRLPVHPDYLTLSKLDQVVNMADGMDAQYHERFKELKKRYGAQFFSIPSNRKPLNYLRFYHNRLFFAMHHIFQK